MATSNPAATAEGQQQRLHLHLQQQQLQQQQHEAPLKIGPLTMPGPSGDVLELSNQELIWAWDIKRAIEEQQPELNNLPDFWYAQLALVDREDVERALERVQHFQIYREEYMINDTLQQGYRSLEELMQMWPRSFLSFSYSLDFECYCFALDFAAMDMRDLSSGEKMNRYMRSAYYFHSAINPNFVGVRNGVLLLGECEGFGWQHISLNHYKKLWSELAGIYPHNIFQLKHFHTGVFWNLLFSMTKRLLPESIRAKYQMGCEFESRLDEVYLVPTVQAANNRFLGRLKGTLKERYDREASFELKPIPGEEEFGRGCNDEHARVLG